jgi:drug/metabolite transporter (DMT)-like permease
MLAACCNAVSNVLQRTAGREVPTELSLSPRLVVDLLHRKVWLAGLITVVLSFVFWGAALSGGQLSLVQPLIVIELPLTFVGAAVVFHAKLRRQEWAAVGLMAAGLAGLILALSPHGGNASQATAAVWGVGIGTSSALIGTLVVIGRSRTGATRAALFGSASGLTFGLAAALMKATTAALSSGWLGLLTTWQTYAMCLAGLLAMFLMQNALQAGSLVAAQPGITLLDPFAAILWGVVGFGEQTNGGALVLVAAFGGAVMAAGAFGLSRSPLLQGDSGAARRPEGTVERTASNTVSA